MNGILILFGTLTAFLIFAWRWYAPRLFFEIIVQFAVEWLPELCTSCRGWQYTAQIPTTVLQTELPTSLSKALEGESASAIHRLCQFVADTFMGETLLQRWRYKLQIQQTTRQVMECKTTRTSKSFKEIGCHLEHIGSQTRQYCSTVYGISTMHRTHYMHQNLRRGSTKQILPTRASVGILLTWVQNLYTRNNPYNGVRFVCQVTGSFKDLVDLSTQTLYILSQSIRLTFHRKIRLEPIDVNSQSPRLGRQIPSCDFDLKE